MENGKKRGRPVGLSRCECSVVGYLNRDALITQLSALVASGKIGHFWAVEHSPDEDVRKHHWHLRMTPPPSRAVDWAAICDGVAEQVAGEPLPRKLVLFKGSINDKPFDALLYARHDSGYLAAKGLVKATRDYPASVFVTDNADWFAQLWAEADQFEPEPKRLSKADILSLLDVSPDITPRQLLRLVLLNDMTQGDYNLFRLYLSETPSERNHYEN